MGLLRGCVVDPLLWFACGKACGKAAKLVKGLFGSLLWILAAIVSWFFLKKFARKAWMACKKLWCAIVDAICWVIRGIAGLFRGSSESEAGEGDDELASSEDLTDKERYEIEKKEALLKKDARVVQKPKEAIAEEYVSSAQIVSIAEPIGKWTRYVMSERSQSLADLLRSSAAAKSPEDLPNGFWQLFVRMPSRYKGKYMARSK
ncbi:MAG: hypothetical protein ACTJLK_00520 [Anaplasma sp.]